MAALALLTICALFARPGAAKAVTLVNSCQTLNVSDVYRLTANLIPASGDCLTVAADFVTIDLNSFLKRNDHRVSNTLINNANFAGNNVP